MRLNLVLYWHYLLILMILPCSLEASDTILNIKVDQFGYRTVAEKIAVVSSPQAGFNGGSSYEAPQKLYVINLESRQEVFSGIPAAWNNNKVHQQSGDKVWWFDFSELSAPGDYYIIDSVNNIRSDVFTISDHVYNHVLKHAVRMFYYQRCGLSKKAPYAENGWADEACHIHQGQDKACRSITGAGPVYDLSGGWHDAGDFNKYTTFTYSVVHKLLYAYQDNPAVFQDNYNIPESGNGIPDLLDELKFELDFLQKMMLEDGSALQKVSVTEHQSESPVSADQHERFYAPASSSATRCLASLFAHTYLVFSEFDELKDYAETLLDKSKLAWQWVKENPEYSTYDNSGFASANPERSEYDQDAYLFTAATYLYLATGEETFQKYVESNYQQIHAMDWGYWYGYEYTYQRALLDYAQSPEAAPAIRQAIHQKFKASMQGNEFIAAVNNQTDAYKAYLKDGDYGWGSNSLKSKVGGMFYDMHQFGIDVHDEQLYISTAEDYLHYLHGRNALGKMFLTNMNEHGAFNSANQMYHLWFRNGSAFDHAQSSQYGPPSGYLTGGPNKNYRPDASYDGPKLEPPLNQPVQKSYKDWNTSWPENSWEITEPAIYYQAAYIMLLSKFASGQAIEIDVPKVVTGNKSMFKSKRAVPYPNPASHYLTIPKASSAPDKIELISMDGRIMHFDQAKIEDRESELRLDIREWDNNIFLVRITYRNVVESHKIVLQ